MNLPVIAGSPPVAPRKPLPPAPPPPRGLRARLARLSHPLRILLGARTRKTAMTGPLFVQIGIADSCNYRCQFCWDHPSYTGEQTPFPDAIAQEYYEQFPDRYDRTIMSWDMFTGIVDDLHALGTRKIKFIGRGEPFLNKRCVDMVEYARQRRFNTTVTTNGSLMTRDHARRLVKAGLSELFVSVNAASAEVYTQVHLRTKPEAFERARATLELIADEKARQRSKKPFVNVSFVIQNNNYEQLPDMVRLTHAVGAERALFNYICAYPGIEFLVPDEKQNADIDARLLPQAERLAAELGVETNANLFRDRFVQPDLWRRIHKEIPCYVGWYFAIILADGTVNPCCQCLRTVGSLEERRFADIWKGALYEEFRAESSDLVKNQREVKGCHCYDCGMAPHNLTIHRVLNPLSRGGLGRSGFSFRDFRRFLGRR